MFPLQKRHALIAVLGAKAVNDVAIGVLRARPPGSECRAREIPHRQGAQRAGNGARGADWGRLPGKGLLIGHHELGRPRQAGQWHPFEPGTPEIPSCFAVAIDEAVAVLRRAPHYTRSHSFSPDGGFPPCPVVTTSIFPSALTLTPTTRNPAAITALTVLVTSP